MLQVSFPRQWLRWNTAAWLAGYVLYTPIGHGITGGHDHDLTPAQLVAHSIALAVVAVIVATAQRRVLTQYVSVTWVRVAAAAVAFNIAFWIGYYQPFVIGTRTFSSVFLYWDPQSGWVTFPRRDTAWLQQSRCLAFRSPASSESSA